MRILYLCSDLGIPVLGPKGAAVHVREMVTAFTRAGHSVALAAACLNKSAWERPAVLDGSPVYLPPADDVATAAQAVKRYNETLGVTSALPGEIRTLLYQEQLAPRLIQRFSNDRPDFIYERAALYGTAGTLLSRELHCPRIVELNAPLSIEQAAYRGTALGELAARAERWTLAEADAVLTVSRPLRDYVIASGVEPERVRVLPNGVDAALFCPGPVNGRLRRQWGTGEGPVLGFIGGLRPWHGAEALPVLLERLAPRYPTLHLVIAGDGPLRDTLESELECRGLRQRAVFARWVPHEHVPEVIRHFDVALAPYFQTEHLWYFSPLKLFEYMACGTAVVAPALGQIAEVIRDGETGLLYPQGDMDALVAACDRVLSDCALRHSLGRAAAAEIRSRYTWDHNVACVEELAGSLVASTPVH